MKTTTAVLAICAALVLMVGCEVHVVHRDPPPPPPPPPACHTCTGSGAVSCRTCGATGVVELAVNCKTSAGSGAIACA